MSEMPKFVTKKRVTVICKNPFRIGLIPYSGVCRNVVLTVQDISKCLENHAGVLEILSNGQELPLNFANYDTYNGPTDVTDDSDVFSAEHANTAVQVQNDKGETVTVIKSGKDVEPHKKNVIKVNTKVEPEEKVEVKSVIADTQSSIEVTAESAGDTTTEVKSNTENETDTKVEVEANKQNNNNFQHNKKNKFK